MKPIVVQWIVTSHGVPSKQQDGFIDTVGIWPWRAYRLLVTFAE